jgi:hypothetical protein
MFILLYLVLNLGVELPEDDVTPNMWGQYKTACTVHTAKLRLLQL